MELPPLFYSGFAIFQYILLLYILVVGIVQYVYINQGKPLEHPILRRSLVPIGFIALAVGFMAMIDQIRLVFDAIQAAGDISPGLVAGGIGMAYPHLILGILSLIIALIFKYTNQ